MALRLVSHGGSIVVRDMGRAGLNRVSVSGVRNVCISGVTRAARRASAVATAFDGVFDKAPGANSVFVNGEVISMKDVSVRCDRA